MTATAQPVRDNPLDAWLDRYEGHAELFVRECFNFPNDLEMRQGKDIYPWQRDVMAAYDRGEPRIAIRSGHGVGKTTVLAWLLWHRILCRFPQKTAVTAPSEKQLFDALWAEFETWGKRLPEEVGIWNGKEGNLSRGIVDVKADHAEHIKLRSESFISIKTARAEQPGALQGLHSEWELVMVDEASDVPDTVWEAAQSSLTGPHPMAIVTGNPLARSGFFHRVHTDLAHVWWTRHVPRGEVVKDLSQDSYTQGVIAEWGEQSNAYRVRVEGEFPISEDDVVIPFDLVEPALTRDVQVGKSEAVIWGLDCARFGSNRSALAKRQTRILLEPIRWWVKLDAEQLAARVKLEWDSTPLWLRPVVICVDEIGMGGPIVDRLKGLGLPIRGVNVQETPALQSIERFKDLRTELWFKAKEWFASRVVRIPASYAGPSKDNPFLKELTGEHFDFQGGKGRARVLPKDAQHSPDLADAFVLTFAADAVTLARGRERRNEPYKPKLIRGLV